MRLLTGRVGSREAKPQTRAAPTDTGHTGKQRPGLPQPRHVWRPPSRANVGSSVTGMSSEDKTLHEKNDQVGEEMAALK